MNSIFRALASLLLLYCGSLSAQITLIELVSDTGDILMIHRLNDGELWGSFIITDQVADSFADNELIVLQIDQNKPIKLEHQKVCGGGKADQQQVMFGFDYDPEQIQWLFSQVKQNNPDILKLAGWDHDSYDHMRADRRPEVVDFAIQGELAVASLLQQFQQGSLITFRYTTESGETRQAEFHLQQLSDVL
ncbi:MAG: hypothetical protein IBX57_01370 [Gammaproteobacteria bacterium]|nr:hypothetical protein [Gammaproteobacteria bacterium]